jgi:hypothetical protein
VLPPVGRIVGCFDVFVSEAFHDVEYVFGFVVFTLVNTNRTSTSFNSSKKPFTHRWMCLVNNGL